ncbi:MAG: hypothetical protein GWN58_31355 [Anaerolineae bacterium]|nr:hypothetical protein [Anaerolineae bacterium]
MAPFLTHLVVGERVWAALDGKRPAADHLGTFLFGCLAPDVDKFCHGLEQGTTHFVAKDEAGTYVWLRSQRFLEGQDDFLRAPFHALEAAEQAFVIGYLCHIATDEITARSAQAIRSQSSGSRETLPNVDAILTTMDPRFWAMTRDSAGLVQALNRASIPDRAFVFTEGHCLRAMYKVVVPQIVEGGGLEPFMQMLRRQWQWTRHGRLSDETDDPQIEADLAAFRRRIEADLPTSERMVAELDLEFFLQEASRHSLQRIDALLAARSHKLST